MRLAIAKACPHLFEVGRGLGGVQVVYHVGSHQCAAVNPLGDLNAMHEVEKTLLPMESDAWQTYVHWLAWVTPLGLQDHATAAQRAEAFCRTIYPDRFK